MDILLSFSLASLGSQIVIQPDTSLEQSKIWGIDEKGAMQDRQKPYWTINYRFYPDSLPRELSHK